MKIKRQTVIIMLSFLSLAFVLHLTGWLNEAMLGLASGLNLFDNLWLPVLILSAILHMLLFPANRYMKRLMFEISRINIEFDSVRQKHKDCCNPEKAVFCKDYISDLQDFRKGYKKVDQLKVFATIFYEVSIFGFLFGTASRLPSSGIFNLNSLWLVCIRFILIALLLTIAGKYLKSYVVEYFKKKSWLSKAFVIFLSVVAVLIVIGFQWSELLLLAFFISIQFSVEQFLQQFRKREENEQFR